MDEQSKALLSDVRTNWRCRKDTTNALIAEVLTSAGLTLTVQNVIHVLHSPMPQFCWWSVPRNEQAFRFCMTKLAYADYGTNQTFHVSDDGHLALLKCSPDMVIVFQDETDVVREALYSR